MTISTVQNYRVKVMQFFSMRCNLEFRKLTFYGLTRPQSIRKSKQISGQVILSSPQDLEFNPKLRKIETFQWLKIALHGRPVTPAVLTTVLFLFNADHMPNSSIQSILHLSTHLSYLEDSVCLDTIYSIELPKSRLF